MNVVCPGTWRALCNRLIEPTLSKPTLTLSIWAPVIRTRKIVRSLQLCQTVDQSFRERSTGVLFPPHRKVRSACSLSATSRCRHAKFSTSTQNYDFGSTVSSWLTKRKEFSSDEIKSIFGPRISVSEGNNLIHQVQEQRLAGTIDQEIPGSQRHKGRALAWLRKNVPFDEDRAILRRLEREEQASYKPQAQQKGGQVYAESVLERIRKDNLAKRERKEQEAEARAKAEGKKLPLSPEQALVQKQEQSAVRRKRWLDNAKKDELLAAPQMSFIRRVGPATLLTATVICFCIMFAQNYSPPSQAARLFSNSSPAAATMSVLVGLNCFVWLGWRWLPLRRLMNRVFILVPAYPWASSMIGSLFSHQAFRHLVSNMIALWFVGTNCAYLETL